MKRHKVVSLFSGCGGMDLGFVGGFRFLNERYDAMPYEIVWANDISEAACRTYEKNLKHGIVCADISDIDLSSIPKADVVLGGFPCQDVSINGKLRAENGKRTILYQSMIEVIEKVRPKIFVAENVKGLLQAHGHALFKKMLADFEATGYAISHRLYLASEFGVPQRRERIFIVGVSRGEPFRHPTPNMHAITAMEALADLEQQSENPETLHVWSKAARSPEQGSRRLSADKPATTIRAECHGNIQWHYRLNRRISLREAARLQSFPDKFMFHGGMRSTERQIGNAVPPVLAWHIAKAVGNRLDPEGF